jgi:hypothetical protein
VLGPNVKISVVVEGTVVVLSDDSVVAATAVWWCTLVLARDVTVR